MELPGKNRKHDHILLASIFLLTGLGLVTLYSSSYAYAQRVFSGDGTYLLRRQIVFGGMGFAIFYIASVINLELIRKFIKPLVFLSLFFCILPFIPFLSASQNVHTNTARWIGIGGQTFQPSELVKLSLPLYLAHIFDKKKENLNSLARSVIPPAIITALFFIIIFLQNNFSTAIFLALNALFIFFLAGIKFRFFLSAIFIIIPSAAFMILNKEHRILRVMSFVIPEYQPLGAGYQVSASVSAINSGGFWGTGIGQGIRKIVSVPEIHSDFIFASYAEEMGFLGVILFCLLFGVFTVRGYLSSMKNKNPFYRLLGAGLVTMIISQVLLNISVTAGALPATGIPLPFFSSGGSSFFITLIMAGIIVNISRNTLEQKYNYTGNNDAYYDREDY